MNYERMLEIRSLILAEGTNFGMEAFFNNCGTASCIAGHTVALYAPEAVPGPRSPESGFIHRTDEGRSYTSIASEMLGLDFDSAYWLFYGDFSEQDLDYITPEAAAAAIDYLIAGKPLFDETHTGYVVLFDKEGNAK